MLLESTAKLSFFFWLSAAAQYSYYRFDLASTNRVALIAFGAVAIGCASGCSCLAIVVLPIILIVPWTVSTISWSIIVFVAIVSSWQ